MLGQILPLSRLELITNNRYTDECYSQLAAHPGELNGSAPGVNCGSSFSYR